VLALPAVGLSVGLARSTSSISACFLGVKTEWRERRDSRELVIDVRARDLIVGQRSSRSSKGAPETAPPWCAIDEDSSGSSRTCSAPGCSRPRASGSLALAYLARIGSPSCLKSSRTKCVCACPTMNCPTGPAHAGRRRPARPPRRLTSNTGRTRRSWQGSRGLARARGQERCAAQAMPGARIGASSATRPPRDGCSRRLAATGCTHRSRRSAWGSGHERPRLGGCGALEFRVAEIVGIAYSLFDEPGTSGARGRWPDDYAGRVAKSSTKVTPSERSTDASLRGTGERCSRGQGEHRGASG